MESVIKDVEENSARKMGILGGTRSTVLITKGVAYELTFEHDRWVQRNKTTVEEIRLSLQWEIDLAIQTGHKFDDLRPSRENVLGGSNGLSLNGIRCYSASRFVCRAFIRALLCRQ